MITEDYVSFETAKLLKKKGFDAECDYFYADGTLVAARGGKCDWNNGDTLLADYENECSAPTLQMAMKWLREVHKLGVFPSTYYRHLNKDKDIHDYGSTIVNLNTFEIIGDETPPINGSTYTFEADTYEETAEKAIKYCLENLI